MFERQGRHLLLLAGLIGGLALAVRWGAPLDGTYRGQPTRTWFWLAIAVPIAHQVYVWFCWRLELLHRGLTRRFGRGAFPLYAVGFLPFLFGRFFAVYLLALSNRNSLAVDRRVLDVAAILILLPSGYLLYSVARYFTFRRALGIDHFDPAFRGRPLVRQGIFRLTRNAMYTFGLLPLWLPGLMTASSAALLAALFGHLYIWVHYYCTELPDIRRIYGPGQAVL